MSDQSWLSYLGAVAGVVGTITGCVALWRTGRMKSLDLRIELRRLENELRNVVEDLPELLRLAGSSHQHVAAATGRYNSGHFQQWLRELGDDRTTVDSMVQRLPPTDANHSSLSHQELEEKLSSTHEQLIQAKAMRDKYRAVLSADDRERDHIRADVRNRNP